MLEANLHMQHRLFVFLVGFFCVQGAADWPCVGKLAGRTDPNRSPIRGLVFPYEKVRHFSKLSVPDMLHSLGDEGVLVVGVSGQAADPQFDFIGPDSQDENEQALFLQQYRSLLRPNERSGYYLARNTGYWDDRKMQRYDRAFSDRPVIVADFAEEEILLKAILIHEYIHHLNNDFHRFHDLVLSKEGIQQTHGDAVNDRNIYLVDVYNMALGRFQTASPTDPGYSDLIETLVLADVQHASLGLEMSLFVLEEELETYLIQLQTCDPILRSELIKAVHRQLSASFVEIQEVFNEDKLQIKVGHAIEAGRVALIEGWYKKLRAQLAEGQKILDLAGQVITLGPQEKHFPLQLPPLETLFRMYLGNPSID